MHCKCCWHVKMYEVLMYYGHTLYCWHVKMYEVLMYYGHTLWTIIHRVKIICCGLGLVGRSPTRTSTRATCLSRTRMRKKASSSSPDGRDSTSMAASLEDKPRSAQLNLKKKLSLPVNSLQGRFIVTPVISGNHRKLSETNNDEEGAVSLRWAECAYLHP